MQQRTEPFKRKDAGCRCWASWRKFTVKINKDSVSSGGPDVPLRNIPLNSLKRLPTVLVGTKQQKEQLQWMNSEGPFSHLVSFCPISSSAQVAQGTFHLNERKSWDPCGSKLPPSVSDCIYLILTTSIPAILHFEPVRQVAPGPLHSCYPLSSTGLFPSHPHGFFP